MGFLLRGLELSLALRQPLAISAEEIWSQPQKSEPGRKGLSFPKEGNS